MSDWVISGRHDTAPLPAAWRDELPLLLGSKPRRVGRWAELALYGALRCMADAGERVLPPGALLVLTSPQGARAALETALGQMADDLPMPLTFLQTQPTQLLALLSDRLAWRGNASYYAGVDLPQVRKLAERQAGSSGMLLGLVDEAGAGRSDWLRLVPHPGAKLVPKRSDS